MFRNVYQKSLLLLHSKVALNTVNRQIVRGGHAVSYRTSPPPHSRATSIGAIVVPTVMWWWILWHLWHEYEHITGEFDFPKPRAWTNKELGIPPDTQSCR